MLEELKAKWPEILEYIRDEFEITEVPFHTWFEPLKIKSCDGKTAVFIVEGDIFKNYIEKKGYDRVIQIAIEVITGYQLETEFLTPKEIASLEIEETSRNSGSDSLLQMPEDVNNALLLKANLQPRYTFENFVVGPNNSLANAAALAVAESPGKAYKILYIYGGVGLGKTHLMHAVAQYILKHDPKSNILYATSETFTNDYIDSIRTNTPSKFRNKYRDLDVLLIDDVQFIKGKGGTQEEFFHTFNALYERNKQIIISSDKPPKEIEDLEERLRSRFEWGLMVAIQPPDFETRMAILRKKESMEGYNIDDEVIKYIASHIKSNIRELEGALTRVVAKSTLEHISIDVHMAEEILSDFSGSDTKKDLSAARIIKCVAEHYNISPQDICSSRKSKDIAYPRQVAMYLCRRLGGCTLEQIGKELGGKDHTTIMYGDKKIAEDLEKGDVKLQDAIEILKKKLIPQ